MKRQVYVKKGRRYVPLGPSDGFTGFPTDGIWLVQIKDGAASSSCILKIGELPSLYPYANLCVDLNEACSYVVRDLERGSHSINDIVLSVFRFIASKAK